MKKKKILVVDDEEIVVDLCWRVLTNAEYDVTCVSNGEEGLKIASRDPFHLAVIDMLMPGMDGLETFLSIRKKQCDLIGVLITGHGTMDTAIKAMERGFSGFIRKPFTPAELVQVVKDAFHKAALLEENTRLKTLIPLYRLGEKFIASQTLDEILHELIRTVSNQTGAQRISIMLYDEKEACLRFAAAIGIGEEIIHNARIRPGEKIAGWVFQKGKPLILNGGPEDNPRFAPLLKRKSIVAAISFPLKGTEKMLGVLNVSKIGSGSPFSQADIEMLSVICSQAVMAIENVRVMEERAEKVRMRTLFEQYVAPEVAEVLISHRHNPMEVGEIKKITALFADIRNFTPLVQHLPLETLRSFLNEFFDLLTEVIFWHKGTLDKFMGDAVLAIFGAPILLDEPNKAAIFAAIEMVKIFGELKTIWTSTKHPFGQIGLGIGISSGVMFLGNVGSQKRFDYTVIGTDVNLAQRLASEAASGQILVTKAVMDQVGSEFHFNQESPRLLKGLNAPIPVFSVQPEVSLMMGDL